MSESGKHFDMLTIDLKFKEPYGLIGSRPLKFNTKDEKYQINKHVIFSTLSIHEIVSISLFLALLPLFSA